MEYDLVKIDTHTMAVTPGLLQENILLHICIDLHMIPWDKFWTVHKKGTYFLKYLFLLFWLTLQNLRKLVRTKFSKIEEFAKSPLKNTENDLRFTTPNYHCNFFKKFKKKIMVLKADLRLEINSWNHEIVKFARVSSPKNFENSNCENKFSITKFDISYFII